MKRVRKFFPQESKDENYDASVTWMVGRNDIWTSKDKRKKPAFLEFSIQKYGDSVSFYVSGDDSPYVAKDLEFLNIQIAKALGEYHDECVRVDSENNDVEG